MNFKRKTLFLFFTLLLFLNYNSGNSQNIKINTDSIYILNLVSEIPRSNHKESQDTIKHLLLAQNSKIKSGKCLNIFKNIRRKKAESKKLKWGEYLANHPYNKSENYLSIDTDNKEEAETDRPDLAMEQDFLMTVNPVTGVVPYEKLAIANKEVTKIFKNKAPISGVSWQERGPNNIGGRTRALMFDPNDATKKKVWAGGVSGGLWFTNDITVTTPTWNHVNDFWDNLIVTCIAYNPNNTQEFYVGTGEGWFNADAQRGGGIWKTTDGGSTWTNLASTFPGAYTSGSHFDYVNKIVIKNDGTIFAATRGYYTNTGGIMRSTTGGSTWTRVLTQYVSGTYRDWAADIEIAANGDLYASMGIYSAGQVFKSLNTDNGASGTWTNLSANIVMVNAKRVELACAPSNSNIIYAVAQGGSGDNDVEWFKKSIDGGTTWTTLTIPLMVDGSGNHFTRSQAFYNLILAIHPTDPNLVIVGGVDLHRTTNGGTNWTGISHWYGGYGKPEVHADQHAIIFRPGFNNEMLFGNDGGIYYSANAGNSAATPSFASKNTGYNVTQFYACATKNEVNSNYFLAGAQDNGSQKFTMPQIGSTTEASGGDGAFCHIDQLNSNIQITAYTNNNLYRSLDGGNTFPSLISETSGHFINPSDYDSQRKILYLAADNDQLKRISGIDATITNTDISISVGTAQVSAIKVSPYNDVLFLGIENGRIYKFSNASTASPTITRIDNGTNPITNTGWVSSIEVGANDNNILVTYSNYGVTSVWETNDGGTNWYSKEGNLPDMPVRWALYNPNNRNQVLLATEVGVWSTDNFGTTTNSTPVWGPSNTYLAHTRCSMLKYRPADKMVVVSTHGRGLFTSDIFVTTTVADFLIDQNASCTGSLIVNFKDASLKPGNSWAWDVDNNGTTDYTTQNVTHTYSSPGLYTVKLTVNNSAATITKDIIVMSSEPTFNTGCALVSNSNLNNNADIGIHRFALGSIDNTTPHNDGYYQNYSCSQAAFLELNKTYTVTIATGTLNTEYAKVYIDYNDNATFDIAELVADFPGSIVGTRSLTFTTPSTGVVLDKGLRLRVLSRTAPIANACNIGTYGQVEDYTVYVKSDASWTGTVSTSWTTPGNWSYNAVPGATINSKIISGAVNYPIISSNIICKNLTIQSGASVTVSSGNALTVSGNLVNNAGNTGLIIKSNASLLHNSENVQATVEREINAANWTAIDEGWHLLSSPVINQSISGDFIPNGLNNDYDFFAWDEAAYTWLNQKVSINNINTFNSAIGYLVAYQQTGTKTFIGNLHNSDITIPLSFSYTDANDKGYNLLGNPYTTALDWTHLAWDKTILQGANAKIWESNTKQWTDISLLSIPNIIPANQGFLVKALNSGNFDIKKDARILNNQNFYKSTPDLLILKAEKTGSQYCDKMAIKFDNTATLGYNPNLDVTEFETFGESPSIYSVLSNGEKLSINSIPEQIPTKTIINIDFKAHISGQYSINATIPPNNACTNLVLEDLKTNTIQVLNHNHIYTFNALTTDNANRFILHFNSSISIDEIALNNQDIYAYSNNIYIKSSENNKHIYIYNTLGQLIRSINNIKGVQIINMNNYANGYYLVKVITENKVITKKVFIEKNN